MLWGKVFYNLWINYQPRGMISPPTKGELCFNNAVDPVGHMYSADVSVRAQECVELCLTGYNVLS